MHHIHSWSGYNVDLWPIGQIFRVFNMTSCSGHSFFVLRHSYTIFGMWVCHHWTMCHIHSCPLYVLDQWPSCQNYIFITNLCLGKIVFAHRHTKFGTCGWRGYPQWLLLTFFILFHDFIESLLCACILIWNNYHSFNSKSRARTFIIRHSDCFLKFTWHLDRTFFTLKWWWSTKDTARTINTL